MSREKRNSRCEYYTMAEACEKLGVSRSTLSRQVNTGAIKGHNWGGMWMIHESVIFSIIEKDSVPVSKNITDENARQIASIILDGLAELAGKVLKPDFKKNRGGHYAHAAAADHAEPAPLAE